MVDVRKMADGRLRWFVFAFLAAIIIMTALLAWQLYETSPTRWCILAKSGSPEMASSCVSMLIKLLELKNNVVIGLLSIVGLSVLSLAAVALGVRLGLSGPAGLSANIGAEETVISNDSASVTVPTPSAEERSTP